MHSNFEERFYRLVAVKMGNLATTAELQELELLLQQHKDLVTIYLQIAEEKPAVELIDEDEIDSSFALHSMKMQLSREDAASLPSTGEVSFVSRRTRLYNWGMGVAAMLLLAAGFLFFTLKKEAKTGMEVNEVVSRKGSKSILKLPDGTKVWLNADSKLVYGDFSGNTREVSLIGEGYFDVAKDSTKPFIIHADKINIKVLGTAFNVKNYPLDETIETSLIHGKIELTFTERPTEKFILHPNEKLTIKKNQSLASNNGPVSPKIQFNNIVVLKDSIVPETAWMENKLSFSNETLEAIARNLERQFDVTIAFTNEEPKQYSYTGLFEYEDVDKILRVLSLSQHFRYYRTGNVIAIGK